MPTPEDGPIRFDFVGNRMLFADNNQLEDALCRLLQKQTQGCVPLGVHEHCEGRIVGMRTSEQYIQLFCEGCRFHVFVPQWVLQGQKQLRQWARDYRHRQGKTRNSCPNNSDVPAE